MFVSRKYLVHYKYFYDFQTKTGKNTAQLTVKSWAVMDKIPGLRKPCVIAGPNEVRNCQTNHENQAYKKVQLKIVSGIHLQGGGGGVNRLLYTLACQVVI